MLREGVGGGRGEEIGIALDGDVSGGGRPLISDIVMSMSRDSSRMILNFIYTRETRKEREGEGEGEGGENRKMRSWHVSVSVD